MRLYDEFDTRRVRVPDEQPIRVSLNTPRKAVTTAGNMRIVTEETADGHADEFWALALANHARNRPHGPTFIPREFEAPREEAVL
jgi:phage FluMu gp28-like protein